MTEDIIALRGLLEKSSGAGSLRRMIGSGAKRLMELEVGGLTGPLMVRRAPRGC